MAFDCIRDMKKKLNYNKLTMETSPHHILFSANDIKDKETIMKNNPPIRDTKE